ncbi:MAG: carbohydrate binding domain-containing protein, partial [Anaerolineae bacterium]
PTATAQAPPTTAGQVEPLPGGGARLFTNDGLSLTLDAGGRVTALALDDDPLPIAPAPPLAVRDLTQATAPDVPNLLPNPGFEASDAGWNPLQARKVAMEVAVDAAHEGAHALAIRSENEDGQGAVISDPIPVTPGSRYRVSAHFKIEFGYVDEAGNPTFWQDSLYTGSRSITGLYLQWLDASGSPLQAAPQLAAPLHWNAQNWHRITREVVAPPEAAAVQIIAGAKPVAGAVWIDDLAWVQSPEIEQPLDGGELEIGANHVTQTGEVAGLQVAVTYRPFGDHIAITTTVTDPTGGPRALDVAWGLPLDATGWNWWDNLRQSRPITSGEDFARAVSADITGYLPVSLYPYAVLENGASGLALALPLDSPRYVLLRYDGPAGRYEGRAHLGISPVATKLENSADFTLLLYRTDPVWGLRAAAEKHTAINPDWYDTSASFAEFTGYTREHYRASGPKADLLKAHNDANVYAAQYTVFELPVHLEAEDAPRPSFDEALQFLNDLSSAPGIRASYPASTICDSAGEPHLKSLDVFPWSDGKWDAIWIPNMDPDLPDGYGAQKLADLEALFANMQQAGLTLNGVFVDNFISVTTVDLCPEHLAVADLPLTYDPNTYRPGVHVASAAWEYLTGLRSLLDAQPPPYRSIVVNFWGLNIPTLLAPFIDAFGSEGQSAKEGGNWDAPILDYRRATAMGRLRSFANQQSNLTLAQIETYAHQALFYGMRTSRGTHAAGWPGGAEAILAWQQEQMRPLAALGWQPIPQATTDHPDVWVERFGERAFTVHNWGEAPATFTLTIDLAALGQEAAGLSVVETVSGDTVPAAVTAEGHLQIGGQLEPGRTAVYWLSR